MNKFYFLFCFLFSVVLVNGQNLSISGQVTDKAGVGLPGAAIQVLQPNDSALIKVETSESNGNFKVENLNSGQYLLKISFISYADYFTLKQITNASLQLGVIKLIDKVSTLNTATVVETVVPVQLKGDTMQYNADAFKTSKDATAEDLVTKMPGISVENGTVKAQGEDVKRITVDGRPFFGDDPTAVLKNIPAEMIDKIQLLNQKSDQGQFTGFDDGNTSKTMNIITKQQFRNGVFGRAYAGYGTDDRYKAGFALNFFKDKRRMTILVNSNNINDQNFSQEDLLGVMSTSGGGGARGGMGGGMTRGGMGGMGGGGRPMGTQGGDANSFLVDQKNGVSTTNSLGINYSNKFGSVDFSGSYFLNGTDNITKSETFRTYFTQRQNSLTYNDTSKNTGNNVNHRINLKFDIKIDSLNSILIQPRFSLQSNNGRSFTKGENVFQANPISATINDYESNLQGINTSLPILYRHSFMKKGRTFSANLTPGYNQNKGNSNLYAFTDYYRDTLSVDTLNQLANLNSQGKVFSSNLTYTEPINKTGQLLITYNNNFNNNTSDKQTYNYSYGEQTYSAFDTSLSNKFNSVYFANSGGLSYLYTKTKWNLTAGITYQNAQLKNEQVFPVNDNLNKTFNSFLPNALLHYKFSMAKNLRVNYRSANNAPTVTQLQNVINNSNPLQLSSGNPNLKQDWQNIITTRYSSVDILKGTSFFAFLLLNKTDNYIASSTYFASADTLIAPGVLLNAGSQITAPVNIDGYYNARFFSSYSFVVKKIKSNLTVNANAGYNRTPGQINLVVNYANTTSAGLGLTLGSNISEKIDFTLSSNVLYNNITNTNQQDANNQYGNLNSRLRLQYQIWKGLVIQTDLNHQYYKGYTTSLDQNFLLWNAAIGYKFLKDQVGELRLSVFDILNQNNSLTRNTTETYYEDVRTNVLTQYFMLTFTYNLKFFKAVPEKKDGFSGRK